MQKKEIPSIRFALRDAIVKIDELIGLVEDPNGKPHTTGKQLRIYSEGMESWNYLRARLKEAVGDVR